MEAVLSSSVSGMLAMAASKPVKSYKHFEISGILIFKLFSDVA
jgi:hypothetical protein